MVSVHSNKILTKTEVGTWFVVLMFLVFGLFTAWGIVNKPMDMETLTESAFLF